MSSVQHSSLFFKPVFVPHVELLQPSPFFTEQLTAFEIWLEHGSEKKKPPEQLPIVLQVLSFLLSC
jgi:regulator-associated protein of mTOR